MRGNQTNGGREPRRVVGEADHRQHVGNGVERQHEIGERADERCLHLERRVAVEGAVVGGEQILDEGQAGAEALHLDPEAATDRVLVARGTVETHVVEGRGLFRHWGSLVTCERWGMNLVTARRRFPRRYAPREKKPTDRPPRPRTGRRRPRPWTRTARSATRKRAPPAPARAPKDSRRPAGSRNRAAPPKRRAA